MNEKHGQPEVPTMAASHMTLTTQNPPPTLRKAVKDLWRCPPSSADPVHCSRAFRDLEEVCRSIYLRLDGSRLARLPRVNASSSVIDRALRNFFCWTGAPWCAGPVPNAEKAAASLHSALLRQSICRTYLVPLDRFHLDDDPSNGHREFKSFSFGPNEVACLTSDELSRRLPFKALARFGARYQFPLSDLDGFYWLVTSQKEPAGPLERRTWLNVLGKSMSEVNTVDLFRSSFPTPVENALFVLLATFLKDPSEKPWQPFRVPWSFSVTDDPFSDPVTPPDASKLTRDIIGDMHDHFEVPAQWEMFDFGTKQREALQSRWNDLEAMLARSDSDDANFHPLTKHFFVKALSEHGVDEIISNLSCLEATLQRKGETKRHLLMQRYARLVGNDNSFQWVNNAYDLRNSYLHSFADPKHKVTWTDLAQARWAVAIAVQKYLDFATQRPGLNRSKILKQLIH